MKSNIIYSIIILFMLSGCSDSFLEIYPPQKLNEGTFYKTQDDFVMAVNGCYSQLQSLYRGAQWQMSEQRSDNATFQYNQKDRGRQDIEFIDEFIETAAVTPVSGMWDGSYKGISYCNAVLDRIDGENITWKSIKVKKRLTAEALVLRAYHHFNLVRFFGDVPLVLTTIYAEEAVTTKRTPAADVYSAIIADLDNAVANFGEADESSDKGRVTVGTAQSLLGKVYLTLKRYNDAEVQLKKVIDSKKYQLLPNYADVFSNRVKNHEECIFSVQFQESVSDLASYFIFDFAPYTSKGEVTKTPTVNISSTAGWNIPSADLVAAFEAGDKRKDVSIGIWKGTDWDGVTRDIAFCNKYKPPVSSTVKQCNDNFHVIRYADVLLMYAEALNELQTGDPYYYINEVRTRAGLGGLSGLSKEDFRLAVEKERQVELCFENHRWFDLLRTDRAIDVMTEHGKREMSNPDKSFYPKTSFNINADKLVFPIPTKQVIVNKLEQNKGY